MKTGKSGVDKLTIRPVFCLPPVRLRNHHNSHVAAKVLNVHSLTLSAQVRKMDWPTMDINFSIQTNAEPRSGVASLSSALCEEIHKLRDYFKEL